MYGKINITDLTPSMYDRAKSFYGKAKVITYGNTIILKSYDTYVCAISHGKVWRLWEGYSMTTMRHINSFMAAYGFPYGGKKWWDSLPVTSDALRNTLLYAVA